ncbi:ATP-binding protein [Desulfobacca acetoxidans]|uniref:Rad50/SbcC-type AAA domain-containing protein n=1 Tax=Desulfobacca acetoxidans (strain ATCC 700848 / DSM 11109 / ASRB2) TaxID=880072 RepID=F2NIY2_DESAR|nr:AAA family ATPase [Desulfobacca acetoxidans]AEB10747.1 hypothetical protein Desac_2948 [Desulfobacca acetoxidans DSM 11109]
MIRTIHIQNYMAHQDTRIELAPGVTVITGPNNVGKSAVVEAIRAAVNNPSPKNVIRHGAKQAVVSLELDSGEIIEWRRTEKTAAYAILTPNNDGDGSPYHREEYYKLGRDVPEDVSSLLRLGMVETESGSIDIHIGNQRQPIFLLDQTGSQAAAFFAASTEADYLVKMRQALKTRTDLIKREHKQHLQGKKLAEQELARYEPLDDVKAVLKTAESDYLAIQAAQQAIPLLAAMLGKLQASQAQQRRQTARAAALHELESPPSLEAVRELERLQQQLHHTAARLQQSRLASRRLGRLTPLPTLQETKALAACLEQGKAVQHRLSGSRVVQAAVADLAAPPSLEPVADLQEVSTTLAATRQRLGRDQSRAVLLAAITAPPEVADVSQLPTLIARLRECRQQTVAAQKRGTILAPLSLPPDLADLAGLEQAAAQIALLQGRMQQQSRVQDTLTGLPEAPVLLPVAELEATLAALRRAAAALKQRQRQAEALAAALEEKRQDIAAFLGETGVCPLCGSPLDVVHFLDDVHG